MTPAASSSSISLQTPLATSAGTIATAPAEAAPDAASGGFGLLLGAMQQLQQALLGQPATAAEETPAPDAAAADGGNGLPLFGTLLPAAQPGQLPPDTTAQTDAEFDTDTDTDAGAAEQTDPLLTTSLLPVATGVNLGVAPQSVAPERLSAAATTDMPDALAPTAAMPAPLSGAPSDASTAALSTAPDTAADVGIPLSDLSTAAPAKAGDSATPSAAESDFDALLKQFDAPASTATATGGAETATVQHASRAYANAASSSATVPVPVGAHGWNEAIADKVLWFSANKIASAEIHLNPPDLGPLQVRVSTQQDQASIVFTSQHAAVRDALDQALPRLRDMMGSQGMQLLDVSVGGQSAQQHQQQHARNDGPQRSALFSSSYGEEVIDAPVAVSSVGAGGSLRSGIDAYV